MIDILAVLLGNGVMSCEDPSQMLQVGAHAVWNPRKLIHEKEVKDHCHFFLNLFSSHVWEQICRYLYDFIDGE